jgi:hypothetical protein
VPGHQPDSGKGLRPVLGGGLAGGPLFVLFTSVRSFHWNMLAYLMSLRMDACQPWWDLFDIRINVTTEQVGLFDRSR